MTVSSFRRYECSVPRLGFISEVVAVNASKARYRYLLRLQDCYEEMTFKDIRVRLLGSLEVKKDSPDAAAFTFNRDNPVGTPVMYWTGIREGIGCVSFTRSVAQVLSDHASVWVEHQVGCINLSHVEVCRLPFEHDADGHVIVFESKDALVNLVCSVGELD